MKRWRRIGLVAFVALAVALAGLILMSRRTSHFSESVSFLRGMTGQHSTYLLKNPISSSISGVPRTDIVLETDIFWLDKPYDTLVEVARKELRPHSTHTFFAKSDSRFALFQVQDPKTHKVFTLSLQGKTRGRTVVNVQEIRQATWIDRSLDWVSHIFRSEDPRQSVHL